MRTAMASTSIQCYRQIQSEGLLSKRQAQVMTAIKEGPKRKCSLTLRTIHPVRIPVAQPDFFA